jgi:hypothetical protein
MVNPIPNTSTSQIQGQGPMLNTVSTNNTPQINNTRQPQRPDPIPDTSTSQIQGRGPMLNTIPTNNISQNRAVQGPMADDAALSRRALWATTSNSRLSSSTSALPYIGTERKVESGKRVGSPLVIRTRSEDTRTFSPHHISRRMDPVKPTDLIGSSRSMTTTSGGYTSGPSPGTRTFAPVIEPRSFSEGDIRCSFTRQEKAEIEQILQNNETTNTSGESQEKEKSRRKTTETHEVAAKGDVKELKRMIRNWTTGQIVGAVKEGLGLKKHGRAEEEEPTEENEEKGKANPLERTDSLGRTPLHVAVEAGQVEVVQLIVKKGKGNTADYMGWTPLHIACQKGDLELVKFLLDEGNVDVNEQSVDFTTPLHYLVRIKPEESQKELYFSLLEGLLGKEGRVYGKAANNTTARNRNEDTPLHYAADSGMAETVLWLIKNRADIHKQNKFGETALHRAARSGNREIIEVLLQHGANKNVVGKYGTPKDVAASSVRDLL